LAVVMAGCGGGQAVKQADKPAVGAAAAAAAPAEARPARDPKKAMVAVVTTEKGVIKFVLMDQKAPITVANFVKLADSGFYNGLVFHRVVPGFVVQGGDPAGNGSGGPGWSIKGEFTDLPHLKGAVAMARTNDPDSAGSQFYFCLEATPFLNGKYAVFGYVLEGMEVVSSLQVGDRMRDVKIEEMSRDQIPAWVPK
jgi:cyclophilin family peptidyl-prolyl cis-trans isomerase